jgi:hypothetical protein
MPISNINESGSFRDELLKKNLVITKDGNDDWKNYNNQLKDGDKVGQPIDYFSNEGDIKNSYSFSNESLNDVISIGNFIINSKTEGSLSNNKFYYLSNDDKKEYLDINGKLNVGGPSTEPYNIVSSFLNGQGGVGFGSKGLVTNNDIRNTLAGRALAAAGLINDSEIGKIGGQQLAIQLGNNALFHLQKETIGKINLDVWTLFDGKSDKFIKPNYDITVPDGAFGKTIDFLADLGGFSLPKSQMDVDLYSFDKKFKFTKLGNIERANEMLKNTGNGQVMALMVNLNASILSASNSNSKLSYRQGYAPPFKKGIGGKKEVEEPNMYAYGDSYTKLEKLIEPETYLNSPLYDWKSTEGSGFDMDYHNDGKFATDEDNNTVSDFTWYGSEYNNDIPDNALSIQDKVIGLSPDDNPETLFMKVAHRRSLLYKTKELFKNNKIATLTSGHGVKDAKNSQIQNIPSLNDKSVGFMSKGSGVLSQTYIDNPSSVTKPEDIFCRTWTPNDQYNEVRDQLKNDAIYKFIDANNSGKIGYLRNGDLISESVLDDTGHVKVPLYDYEAADTTKVKRYMFSIENLAWLDNQEYLMSCEKGPHGGRIMWFPPYDMSFSESVSVNWDKNQFIGRGESLYTYNNTERTGSLSFKLIMDYPSDYDCLKNSDKITNEIFASIASGCHDEEGVLQYLTCNEIEAIKEDIQPDPIPEIVSTYKPPKINDNGRIYMFFPNDVSSGYTKSYLGYENGLYDYVNDKGIKPPYDNYIEDATNPDTYEIYKKWKDDYLIQYDYKKEDSTVKTYNEVAFEMKNADKPFYLSPYDGTNVDKPAGKTTQYYTDRTNYGLNGNRFDNTEHNIQLPSGDDANGFKCKKPDCKYSGWQDPQLLPDLAEYLKINYTVVLSIYGYASVAGDKRKNDDLSVEREEAAKVYLITELTKLGLTEIDKRLVKIGGVGETDDWSNESGYNPFTSVLCPKDTKNKNDEQKQWRLSCKLNRRVNIVLKDDINRYKPEDRPKVTPVANTTVKRPIKKLTPDIIRRTYTECDHFKKLETDDKFTYDKLKEKLQYFSPAFHSITPEGFNSRLTFLHQCTRQGDTNNQIRPDNLAFGRPPVSILRIGDFFYTKIVIESMSIDYEPLVWDLNPEGVGVQPMIANVTLNFAFIGGSSLNGPIKKLQNAISFNYYANTGIFDGRADTGNKTEEPTVPTETPPVPVTVKAVDNYKLDQDAVKNMAEDEATISSLTLTAEYDKKINRSKATDDGFKFNITLPKELHYDYTFKIYLIGTDINGNAVKEDLNVKSNEFPAGETEIESTCEKVKPEKAYDTITLKDRQLEEYKWASVLDNLKSKDFTSSQREVKLYILGLSEDESDVKPYWTKDGGKISYYVYKKTDKKDEAHVICNLKKDAQDYYARGDVEYFYENEISDIPTMIFGKDTIFNFELEFFRNGKSIKKINKTYSWESEYKPIKTDICKAKYRIKVPTGNKDKWNSNYIAIYEASKLPSYTGITYTDPIDFLPDLNSTTPSENILYFELTQDKFDNFINEIINNDFTVQRDKNKYIEPDMTPYEGYIIAFINENGDKTYDDLLNSTYDSIIEKIEIENLKIYQPDLSTTYYKQIDEINEEDRIMYAGFNNGFDGTKSQLMITEGKIYPTK